MLLRVGLEGKKLYAHTTLLGESVLALLAALFMS